MIHPPACSSEPGGAARLARRVPHQIRRDRGGTVTHVELVTTSPAQTQEVAGLVASVLREGDVVALTGEIGAGKTCFVQGAAAAMGVAERVTSPSFMLCKEYRGSEFDLLHMDVYRLESLQDVLEVGFAEVGDSSAVVFVEWGDAMAPLLPTDHLEVELRLPPLTAATPAASAGNWEPEPRTMQLRAHGPDWRRRLIALQDGLTALTGDSAAATRDTET